MIGKKEYSYIGKRMPRVDAMAKVTGEVKYWADVLPPPGTLAMKVLYSPYAHAKIVKIDTSKVKQMQGVRAIVTSKDMPEVALDFFQGHERGPSDNFPMAEGKVRFVGEEVAAVAADNENIAEEALKLIEVKYEMLESIFDPEESLKPDAPRIYDYLPNNIAASQIGQHGDIEKGFAEADYIFEDEFKTQPHYHGILEKSGCMCKWDTQGNLTIWTPTQTPYLLQWMAGTVLEVPIAKVRIICPYIGGGFGAKAHIILPYMVICAILAKKAGRSVKLDFSRGEDFAWGGVAPSFIIKLKTGVKKDGKLTARQARFVVDSGAHALSAPANMWCAIHLSFVHLYKVPNFKYEAYTAYTNNPIRPVAFRGFGNTQGTWAVESQMDIIAERLGMDPMELRLNNLFESGEVSAEGWKLDAYGLPDCIKQAAEAADWSQKRKERVSNRGIGMASLTHISGAKGVVGPIELSSVILMAKEDGSFNLHTGCSEIGGGVFTVAQQVAAEIMGTRLEDIRIVGGDTAFAPFDLGCYGSRGTYEMGNAVELAATDMRNQLFEIAAPMLEATVQDLDARDGHIFIKNTPGKKVSIAEVTNNAHLVQGTVLISKGIFNAPTGVFDQSTSTWPPPGACTAYPFACQVAEVEVDPETGRVKVLNLTAAHDCGYPINLNSVEGQIEGGIAMGIGFALSENLKHEEGRVLVTDFADYFMCRALDLPEITPIIVTAEDPYGPFGAKGVGEPVFVPTAPAIANAIYHAVGVRIKELPITPEKILKALKERR
ncbi:xanthine dehydrogenase family protein molybdopterin-binding subunit [Chloroflexota bacterium]